MYIYIYKIVSQKSIISTSQFVQCDKFYGLLKETNI